MYEIEYQLARMAAVVETWMWDFFLRTKKGTYKFQVTVG